MLHLDEADKTSWAAEMIIACGVDVEGYSTRELIGIHDFNCPNCKN